MRFVGLEENRALPFAVHAIDFAVIAGGDVQASVIIESQVPDVFGFRLEESLGSVLRFACSRFGVARDLVDLAVRRGGRVDRAVLRQSNGLDLQLLGLEYHAGLAVRGN